VPLTTFLSIIYEGTRARVEGLQVGMGGQMIEGVPPVVARRLADGGQGYVAQGVQLLDEVVAQGVKAEPVVGVTVVGD